MLTLLRLHKPEEGTLHGILHCAVSLMKAFESYILQVLLAQMAFLMRSGLLRMNANTVYCVDI